MRIKEAEKRQTHITRSTVAAVDISVKLLLSVYLRLPHVRPYYGVSLYPGPASLPQAPPSPAALPLLPLASAESQFPARPRPTRLLCPLSRLQVYTNSDYQYRYVCSSLATPRTLVAALSRLAQPATPSAPDGLPLHATLAPSARARHISLLRAVSAADP